MAVVSLPRNLVDSVLAHGFTGLPYRTAARRCKTRVLVELRALVETCAAIPRSSTCPWQRSLPFIHATSAALQLPPTGPRLAQVVAPCSAAGRGLWSKCHISPKKRRPTPAPAAASPQATLAALPANTKPNSDDPILQFAASAVRPAAWYEKLSRFRTVNADRHINVKPGYRPQANSYSETPRKQKRVEGYGHCVNTCRTTWPTIRRLMRVRCTLPVPWTRSQERQLHY